VNYFVLGGVVKADYLNWRCDCS